jgi:hypothetical protein
MKLGVTRSYLRSLPYIPPTTQEGEVRLLRHPLPMVPSKEPSDPVQEIRRIHHHREFVEVGGSSGHGRKLNKRKRNFSYVSKA